MNSQVRMIAQWAQYYGRDLKAGDVFEVTEEHAFLLERTGAAVREPDGPEFKSKNKYRTRDMTAEK